MNLGSSTESRRRTAARRRRRGYALLAVAAVLSAGVITVGTLVALHVIPSPAGRHARTLADRSPAPRRPAWHPHPPPVGMIGRYPVASTPLRIVDRSRPKLGARWLPTLVRYPVVPAGQVRSGKFTKGPFPLVVFAPGYLQCGASYAALLHAWASAGYVVAAVEFPRTHCHVAAPDEADLVNQPADVSFVITRLLAVSARPAGLLSGLVDPGKIAVAGHSDGGDTAAAVAGNTCCRDPRVVAALVLSGAEWPPLRGRYFPSGTPPPPVLFVQGTNDTWNPPPGSVQLYQADTGGIRYYLNLVGADHFAPYEGHSAPEPLVAKVTVDFLNAYLDDQSGQVVALAADGTVPGVAELVSRGRMPG
ncbi:MAG TPA: hypothetical protein VNF47_18200 [Streptosporangiaceae bacterium]|nr:hypothetical protein [Streptosporangiaceae bacterium]